MMSSNKLLVRPGIAAHLSAFDVAVSFNPIDVPGAISGRWQSRKTRESIMSDPIFAHVLGRHPGRPIAQGIHEGLCMRAEFWDELSRCFDLDFPHDQVFYPTEEIYIQNLIATVMAPLRETLPNCHRILEGVTPELVSMLRHEEARKWFSLKRIPRKINGPIRQLIRGLLA